MHEQIKPIETQKQADKIVLVEIDKPSDTNPNLRIFIKSDKNFKIFANKNGKSFQMGGVKCFHAALGRIDGIQGRFYDNNADWYYPADGYPNLSLLLADKLEEGVTFSFEVGPISQSLIENWMEMFKMAVKQIFLTYMKPLSMTCIIDCRSVESEFHY